MFFLHKYNVECDFINDLKIFTYPEASQICLIYVVN